MKMYKTEKWRGIITEKEVIRVTDKSIFYDRNGKEESERIVSSYRIWHKTKEDAKEYLRNKYLSEIRNAEKEISVAKKHLEELDLL